MLSPPPAVAAARALRVLRVLPWLTGTLGIHIAVLSLVLGDQLTAWTHHRLTNGSTAARPSAVLLQVTAALGALITALSAATRHLLHHLHPRPPAADHDHDHDH